MELGDPDQALQWLFHARQLAYEMGDLVGEVRALVNLGRLSSEYGVVELDELDLLTQAELLLDLWPEVVAWHEQQGEDRDVEAEHDKGRSDDLKAMLVYSNLGNLYRDHGSYTRAESYYLRAVEAAKQYLAEESNRAGAYRLIYRLLNLYRLYHLTNETEELRQILEQIKRVVTQSDDPKGQFLAAEVIGEYYAEVEENLEAAYGTFKHAIELSELLREQVPRGEERIGFIGYIRPPFQTTISLAIQLGRRREAFDLAERSKSQQLLDALAETLPQPASEVPPSMLKKERDLFGRWMEALWSLREGVPNKPDRSILRTVYQASEDIRELRSELEKIWGRLELIDPEYISLRRGSPAHFNEILQILSNTQGPVWK